MNRNIKYLIENAVNFDVTDYNDEETDIISNNEISGVMYKYHPKNKEQLQEIIKDILSKTKSHILDLSQIDTSLITDMSDLFSNLLKNRIIDIYEI